jgi:queuine/archaeosine tRNA-ribosyltransferase
MGFRLKKEEVLRTLKHFNVECSELETIASLINKMNNFYGKSYYKNAGNGNAWISSKNRAHIDKIAMATKTKPLDIEYECPVCKKMLPRKKFMTITNIRKKECLECRRKMEKQNEK